MSIPVFVISICAFLSAEQSSKHFRQDILIADFEESSYGLWTVEGKCFGKAPAEGTLPRQSKVTGYRGNRLINSFFGKDAATGRMLSPAFKIQRHHIKLLVGGGMHPNQACVNLRIDGKVVRTATGRTSEQLLWRVWDVKELYGKFARIEILDNKGGGWGHILVDSIIQSDSPEKETFTLKADDTPRWVWVEDGRNAINEFLHPKELEINLFADETQLANPVSICFDEQNRLYVAESHRQLRGIDDNRYRVFWINDDIASRKVADRMAMYKKWQDVVPMRYYTEFEELIRRLDDIDGDGLADKSFVWAGGFDHPLDGTAAGLLVWNGKMYFTCIPHLWLLEDRDDDGTAEVRKSLQDGFGVRVSLRGHDMHGLAVGPDGRLYFGIGDRGYNIVTKEGRRLAAPGGGAVFRCNLDGSNIELYHTGLRNAVDLAFDNYGNLFTVDNNQGGGDDDRLVHIVYGGESGWNMSYQNEFKSLIGLEHDPMQSNPWFAEGMWKRPFTGQPAWMLPALDYVAGGPCGFVFNPGISLPGYDEHFFVCSFMGSPVRSGVETFKLMPMGATYGIEHTRQLLWNILPTDAAFGYDGKMYVSDWINTMQASDSGRIYTIHDPKRANHPAVHQTANLFFEGFAHRSSEELFDLLAHADQRVRQRAQFGLAARGRKGMPFLLRAARSSEKLVTRLHGIWGLGQLGRHESIALDYVAEQLTNPESEIRAQAAKVLGEEAHASAATQVVPLLKDKNLRVRFHAAIALGQLDHHPAVDPLLDMLRENADKDAYLRHAGVMGLYLIGDLAGILKRSRDPSPAVRRAIVLVLRRLRDPRIAEFLHDADNTIYAEAARAINDLPIQEAMHELAWQVHRYIIKKERAEPILFLRILNANYRLGLPENARWLSILAASDNAPTEIRLEALDLLTKWEHPFPVDRITGVHRPLPSRKLAEIIPGVQPNLTALMQTGEGVILAKAMSMAEQFQLKFDEGTYKSLVQNENANLDVRIEAIKQLNQKGIPELAQILQKLVHDSDERMRIEALQLFAEVDPSQAVSSIDAVLRKEGLSIATDRSQDKWEELSIGMPSGRDYADRRSHNGVTVKWLKNFAMPHRLSGAKGEELPRINDGLWARNNDDVDRNTWLDEKRARFVMDLQAPVPITRINTYSWHKTNRAQQVFTLYGANAKRLPDAESSRLSPEWQRIANIDTKPLGEGGIHGTSILAPYGSIGNYRYLLWDVPRLWPNLVESTFFSEIDVYTFGQATAPITAKARPKGVNIPEKQNAIKLLADIEEPSASKVLSKWMEKLIADEVPSEIQLDLLEAAASRKTPEFDIFVQQYNDSLPDDDKLAPYRASLSGGDAQKGETIFKSKPAAQCYVCHSIKGQGGKAAPDLTNVASRQTREFMLESMIFPSAAIAENFGTTLFLLKDDIQLEGIITRRTRDKVIIKTKDNRVIEIPKKNIEARKPSTISPMPAMDKILTKRELRDVIAFLATLK